MFFFCSISSAHRRQVACAISHRKRPCRLSAHRAFGPSISRLPTSKCRYLFGCNAASADDPTAVSVFRVFRQAALVRLRYSCRGFTSGVKPSGTLRRGHASSFRPLRFVSIRRFRSVSASIRLRRADGDCRGERSRYGRSAPLDPDSVGLACRGVNPFAGCAGKCDRTKRSARRTLARAGQKLLRIIFWRNDPDVQNEQGRGSGMLFFSQQRAFGPCTPRSTSVQA